MKKIILLIIMFIPAIFYCQNTHEIIFRITDPVVIKKEYPNATKVNAEIIVQDFQGSLYLYYFSKYVSLSYLVLRERRDFDCYKEKTIGLNCVIENRNNRIILPVLTCDSYRNPEDAFRNAMSRTFVSSEQKYFRKQLDEKEALDYDLAKYEISKQTQSLELFPLLNGDYYSLHLPKGKYFLYFVYSFHETSNNIKFYPSYSRDNNRPDESKIFRGYFVSNKVKLIVE
jgi:hypothetical protein